eukprot:5427812-Pleurochrysis_carterae.AAC.1
MRTFGCVGRKAPATGTGGNVVDGTCSYTPLVKSAFSGERQSESRTVGSRRGDDGECVPEHAIGGRSLPKLVHRQQRVREGGYTAYIVQRQVCGFVPI